MFLLYSTNFCVHRLWVQPSFVSEFGWQSIWLLSSRSPNSAHSTLVLISFITIITSNVDYPRKYIGLYCGYLFIGFRLVAFSLFNQIFIVNLTRATLKSRVCLYSRYGLCLFRFLSFGVLIWTLYT